MSSGLSSFISETMALANCTEVKQFSAARMAKGHYCTSKGVVIGIFDHITMITSVGDVVETDAKIRKAIYNYAWYCGDDFVECLYLQSYALLSPDRNPNALDRMSFLDAPVDPLGIHYYIKNFVDVVRFFKTQPASLISAIRGKPPSKMCWHGKERRLVHIPVNLAFFNKETGANVKIDYSPYPDDRYIDVY